MTKEERPTIVDTYEDNFFAVINEHGEIHFANDLLANCIHIESKAPAKNLFYNYISPLGSRLLKDALQKAGFATNPSWLKMDLLNSAVYKANWHIAKLKTSGQMPNLYFCIGNETKNEKPNNTPVSGIIVTDGLGNIIDANDKAAALLNTNPESLLNNAQLADFCSTLKIFKDPISFEDTPPMKALLAGKAYEQVIEMQRRLSLKASGYTLFSIHSLMTPVPYPFLLLRLSKNFPGKEVKSQEKELFHKEFLNVTSAMTWLIDDQEKLIFANPAFLRFLGIKEKDLNKKAVEVIPPYFKAIFEKEHRKVLATGIAHKKIHKHPLADGTTRYFLVNIFSGAK